MQAQRNPGAIGRTKAVGVITRHRPVSAVKLCRAPDETEQLEAIGREDSFAKRHTVLRFSRTLQAKNLSLDGGMI